MKSHDLVQERVMRSTGAVLLLNARAERATVELCPPIRRIVTIHSGNLRELLFSLPALRALRENFEGARLCAVVREELAPLLKICPFADEVLPRPDGGLSSHAHLMAKLHGQHCDIAVAFSTSRNGTLLALSSGAHVRLGFDGAKMDALLTHRVAREAEGAFVIEDYLDLARALGAPTRTHDYSETLCPPVDSETRCGNWLKERGLTGEFILLAPQRERKTPRTARPEPQQIQRWAKAAAVLSRRAPVVISGARPNRTLLAAALEEAGVQAPIFDAGGAFDWPAYASLSRNARLYAGWCGGHAHLAAAMSTPVIALTNDKTEDEENEHLPGGAQEPRGVTHRLLKSSAAPEEIERAACELIGL